MFWEIRWFYMKNGYIFIMQKTVFGKSSCTHVFNYIFYIDLETNIVLLAKIFDGKSSKLFCARKNYS